MFYTNVPILLSLLLVGTIVSNLAHDPPTLFIILLAILLSCIMFLSLCCLQGEADCQGCGCLEAGLLPPHAQPLPHAPHPHPRHQRQVRLHRGPWGHRRHPHLQHPLPQVVELCAGGGEVSNWLISTNIR